MFGVMLGKIIGVAFAASLLYSALSS